MFEGDETWRALRVPEGSRYAWEPSSTYVQEPPFFTNLPAEPPALTDITDARVLAVLGDSVPRTTSAPPGRFPRTDRPRGI